METKTDIGTETTKEEKKRLYRQRHYKKVKERKTLEKLVMQRVWDEFAETQDTSANGMIYIESISKLVECVILAVYKIERFYNRWSGDVERICYDWLYDKKVWTGKFVSERNIFTGKWDVNPETVLIRDYLQFDNGEDKDDPLYDGFWNMLTHTFDSLRPISEHDLAVKYIGLLIREEAQKLEIQNTCKDIAGKD